MSLWSMNDGSALTHNITTDGDATIAAAGATFEFGGSANEVSLGDIVTTSGESLRVISITSATAATVSPAAGTSATAAGTVRKPPTDGKVALPGTDVFGVSVAEGAAGSDNITAIGVTATNGARYVEVPLLTVAAPTARTILAANVTNAANTMTITGHNMATGTKLTWGHGSGTQDTGLTNGTAYYVIKIDDNTIKLATSLSNANAGTVQALGGDGNNTQTLTGDTATGTAAISSGVVSAITVTGVGSDYQSVPAVTINGPRMTIPTSGVNAGSDVITFAAHGLTDTDQIRYQDGGGTAMTNQVDNTIYFVRDKTTNTFKVAATSGGSAIDIAGSSTGSNAQYYEIVTDGVTATATASRGAGGTAANTASGFHVGWVKRTVGTGGRAGRINYETLVAASSITGDHEDIAFVEDA